MIRKKIGRIIDAKTDRRWRADRTIYPASMEYLQQVQIPEGTPPPFTAYLRGAIAHHLENMEAARTECESIFELAPEHRGQRPVWAAYILGKYHLDCDPDQAIEWFQKPRNPIWNGTAPACKHRR